jgi:translation initiation factor 1
LETICLSVEKTGRRGKTVTILEGFTRRPEDLEEIARAIKVSCGTGGTVRHKRVEIQGDFRQAISVYLKKQGFQIKGF